MATVKIATLLVRTLAKPIATQMRTQAAQHDSFRRICVGIAQRLHRVEMGLRWGLVPKAPQREREHSHSNGKGIEDGAQGEVGTGTSEQSPSAEGPHHFSSTARPKVRPLNEAKAIANGATFISEAFLFTIAAALILGESWRTSTKNRKQRDRTEDRVEEVARAVEVLGRKLGIETGLQTGPTGTKEDDLNTPPAGEGEIQQPQKARGHVSPSDDCQEAGEAARLRKVVDVLLRLAINGGLIQGQDALDLNSIAQTNHQQPQQRQIPPDPRPADDKLKSGQTAADPVTASTPPSPILQQLAAHRARQISELSRLQAEA